MKKGKGLCRRFFLFPNYQLPITSYVFALFFSLVTSYQLLVTPFSFASQEQLFEEMRYEMGTLWRVALYAPDCSAADRAFDAAFGEIKRLDRLMSDYDEKSELSRLNRAGYPGPVSVDPELFDLIDQSVALSEKTDGAFDVTVGPLVRLWGFRGGTPGIPSEEAIARALEAVGFRKLKLDRERREVSFLKEGMALDLGAIGKGYAVDRAVLILRERGIKRALVDAGGMLFGLGSPPGERGWRVGIADPANRDRVARSLTIRDEAVATSSQSERFMAAGGRRFGHVLDPRTGRPVDFSGSVTVRAPTAALADALSTASFVLGSEASRTLAKTERDVKIIRCDTTSKRQLSF